MSYRWSLYDPVLDVLYVVPRNPDQMGSPYVKNETHGLGVSPIDARSRISRKPDQAMDWEFGGTTASQAHYDALLAWCAKPYRITLTDHLGRVFSVRLLQFDAKPHSPTSFAKWKFRYTVKALIYPRGISVIGETAVGTGSVPLRISLTGVAATGTGEGVPGAVL